MVLLPAGVILGYFTYEGSGISSPPAKGGQGSPGATEPSEGAGVRGDDAGTSSLSGMAEEEDEQADLAERQAEIAAAMDETLERQREVQRRQDALLDQLGRIDRALDRESGND